ncbi:MAG TPA: Virginiamycin B lyase [Actinomycetota bacterium]|nr:Virginiamycin B lyase [Actinomycetota bacterium]
MRWTRLLAVLATVASVGALAPAAFATGATAPCSTGCVTEYTPTGTGRPFGITRGPLGSEWFAQSRSIRRVDASGTITRYHVPGTKGNDITWLTTAPDGSLWFTRRYTDSIGRITRSGGIREFAIPSGSGAMGVVVAPDGFVYFSELGRYAIGRLDPATGATTEYPVPSGASPVGLCMGPDGSLWFTEEFNDRVGRMTTDGVFTEYALASGARPVRIAVGPDGAIWFTELSGKVGRITSDGTLTEYPLDGGPVGITTGKDGLLYVALAFDKELVQMDPQGVVTGTWTLPEAGSGFQVARGFGRDIWVTDYYGRHVYRVTPWS